MNTIDRIEPIVMAVCEAFSIDRADLMGRSREERYSWPRMVAWYALREGCNWTLQEIGEAFDRDHSTIHSGVKRVALRFRTTGVDRALIAQVMAAAPAVISAMRPDTGPVDAMLLSVEAEIAQAEACLARLYGVRQHLTEARSLMAGAA